MSDTREINVYALHSINEGGCNGCNDHKIDLKTLKTENYRVWQIRLRGISIRLCDECVNDLQDKLHYQFRHEGALL